MAEQDQERPLAPAAERERAEANGQNRGPSKQSLRKRRCILCCSCCAATILILGVLILVLALTVFKVKDPKITMNSIRIQEMNLNLSLVAAPSLEATLIADLSIKNPNIASFKFGNSTTMIFYQGNTVGNALAPAGKASARRTLRMNVTIYVFVDHLVGDFRLYRDVLLDTLDVNTYTKIGGRVNVLNLIKRHVDVSTNCTINISMANKTAEVRKCDRSVRL